MSNTRNNRAFPGSHAVASLFQYTGWSGFLGCRESVSKRRKARHCGSMDNPAERVSSCLEALS